MSSRVGGAVGTTSISRTLSANKLGVVKLKWEGGGTPASSITGAINTWTLAGYSRHTSGNEPGLAWYYCLNTAAGAETFTPSFTGSGTFLHGEMEEWTSATGAFALDGSPVFTNTGTGTGVGNTYNTSTGTATGAGVAFYGVSDFNSLSTLTGGGTPAFAVGNGGAANGDSFLAYATVTGAGAVSPSIQCAGGATQFVTSLIIFKEVTAGANLEDVLHRPAMMAILAQ